MIAQIKRIDTDLPLPVYETSGSVGFDLCSRIAMEIQPREIALVPANVIIKIPDGYMLALACRSSTPKKKGLMMPHGFGVIDLDYCGPEDELRLQLFNFTEGVVSVVRGEKIAQGIFVRVDRMEWEEVDKIDVPTRGGFGSSGGYV
jgi:dUTP pyrophosphatase